MFDKEEWMEEVSKKDGEDWVSFRGKPVMEFCDIRLKDGREIGPCWPKESEFVDLSSDEEDTHSFSDVTHVKYYKDDEDGDNSEVDECEDDEV